MKTEGCVRKRLAILDCEDAGKWNNHEQVGRAKVVEAEHEQACD